MNVKDPQRRRQKLLKSGELMSVVSDGPPEEPRLKPYLLDETPHIPTTTKLEIYSQKIYNEDTHVTVWENKAVFDEIKRLNKFTDMLRAGISHKMACNRLHTSMTKILNPKTKKAQDKVRELLETYTMEAGLRTKLVRAATNKIAIESLESGDYKTALAAAKQISDDPETGMGPQHVTSLTQVNLDSGFLKALNNVEIPKEIEDMPEGKLIEGEVIK